MSHLDIGLVKQSYNDRFDELYRSITNSVLNSKSRYVQNAKEMLANIKQDLSKLTAHKDKGLESQYKISLVPMLEHMFNKLRYF